MAGPVEKAIRENIAAKKTYFTPDKRKPFSVDCMDTDGIVLLFGPKRTKTRISWQTLEGIPTYLIGKGWVEIGTVYSVHSKPDTLDEYLKKDIYRATASWVASILQQAGICQISGQRPRSIRLAF